MGLVQSKEGKERKVKEKKGAVEMRYLSTDQWNLKLGVLNSLSFDLERSL